MKSMWVTETQLLDALREVVDPEMGIDLVSLGLIYDVQIRQASVAIQMTLTMRGCPMHDSIVGAVRRVVLNLEGADDVEVQVVWDPPWNPSMMTLDAQERMK
jgi:metal-sulfur cluster biosynthetic enzyme